MKKFSQVIFVSATISGIILPDANASFQKFHREYVPMFCAYGEDAGVRLRADPCRKYIGIVYGKDDKGRRVYTFEWRGDGGKVTRFVGVGGEAVNWWVGSLNGKKAVGYSLNRAHIVFTTLDGSQEFEAWGEAMEHGQY